MLAYEAYGKRSDLYDTHMNSKAMGQFLRKVFPIMNTGLDLVHYEDVGGFLDKKGNKTECGIIWDTWITVKEGKVDKVLESLKGLAKWVEESEPEAYSYLIHRGLDEDNRNELRVLERYATREGMEAHMSSKPVLDFFRGAAKDVVRLENRGYLPNGLGWLHR